MRQRAAARTAGLPRKATPNPAAFSIGKSLAPSPTASVAASAMPISAARTLERRKLCLAPENGRHEAAGELPVLHLERVRDVEIEAERVANGAREHAKAAGDERASGALGAHGADERPCARHDPDPRRRFAEDAFGKAAQQSDALVERRQKIDLAVHGAPRDRGDVLLEADEIGELLKHLILDDRRFEIGDEELLAPCFARLRHEIDGATAKCRARGKLGRFGRQAVERQIDGAGRKRIGIADAAAEPRERRRREACV